MSTRAQEADWEIGMQFAGVTLLGRDSVQECTLMAAAVVAVERVAHLSATLLGSGGD